MVNNITSHNNTNHFSIKPQTVMVNNIASHNNMNHSSVKHETVMVNNITATTAGYVVDHYCLMFHRGVVHIVVAG
jgi:hypothetical protein